MPQLRGQPDDLFALVGAASEANGMPPSWVEKDFWIVELLRSVTKPIEDIRVVFKGGTSLSKAYGMVERFSEDVDILVVLTRELSKDFGKGSIGARMKEITERVSLDLRVDPEGTVSDTGVKRNTHYSYPTRVEADLIPRRVLLEMGRRGSDLPPAEAMEVTSFVAQHAVGSGAAKMGDFEEFTPVVISTLRPERTLFEKLELLHDSCSRYPEADAQDSLNKAGRHLYDVTMLLRAEGVVESLANDTSLPRLLDEDIARVSETWGYSHTPRPAGGYAESPAFDASAESAEVLREAYAAIETLVYGDLPTFQECIETVHAHGEYL
jgi:Nucleotidyl transferase AbiEii toxin, Type IV TA system